MGIGRFTYTPQGVKQAIAYLDSKELLGEPQFIKCEDDYYVSAANDHVEREEYEEMVDGMRGDGMVKIDDENFAIMCGEVLKHDTELPADSTAARLARKIPGMVDERVGNKIIAEQIKRIALQQVAEGGCGVIDINSIYIDYLESNFEAHDKEGNMIYGIDTAGEFKEYLRRTYPKKFK